MARALNGGASTTVSQDNEVPRSLRARYPSSQKIKAGAVETDVTVNGTSANVSRRSSSCAGIYEFVAAGAACN